VRIGSDAGDGAWMRVVVYEYSTGRSSEPGCSRTIPRPPRPSSPRELRRMAGTGVDEPGHVSVTSGDGTRIVASVGGQGPPIVLVHRMSGSDFSWAWVRPHLEDRHAVYAMQRRGRGLSGDGPDYSLARETEDVAALVDRIGGPVCPVGHS
jgi:pimeloyl-ACP methyl ester carboxylesterase